MPLPELFLKQLRIKSGVPLLQEDAGTEFQPLYDDDTLSYILEESALIHSGRSFMESLADLPYIFLLARKEVYTILAGAFAKNYDIGSRDGKLSKSQPSKQYLALIKQMEDMYLRLTKNSSVKTTPILLTNSSRNVYRNYLNAPPPRVSLFVEDMGETQVTFRLSNLSSVDVDSFDLYASTDPIYDMFEAPPISPTSSLVQSKLPFTGKAYTFVRGDANPQYLGVLTRNKYGKQYLLETFIGVDSTPPQEETTP